MQGRAKRKESAGGPTMSGGVSLAAATAVAQGQTQGKKHEDFYRFQQRDKRRNGEQRTAMMPYTASQCSCTCSIQSPLANTAVFVVLQIVA